MEPCGALERAGPFTVATCPLFVLAPVESVHVAVDLCHGEGKRIVNVKVHTLKDELCSVVYAGCTGQFEASEEAANWSWFAMFST